MPYANEHAARQTDPDQYDRFRRIHPDGFPAGVDAILGIKAGGGSEIQSVRFDAGKFTPTEAKKWLADHDMKTTLEEATASSRGRVVCAREAEQIVYAVAMEPNVVDEHGDATTADEIRHACHRFMRKGALLGVDHREQAVGAAIVESWICSSDVAEMYGQPVEAVKAGSWIVGIYLPADLWAKRNEITGVSIAGRGLRTRAAPAAPAP